MFAFLNNKQWFKGNASIGVHVQLLSEGKEITLCEARKEGKEIKKKWSRESLGNIEDINEKVDQLPSYLSIDGKGVMHLKVSKDEVVTESINRILPNVKLHDFFIQEYILDDQKWISLIRKDSLSQILDDLKNVNIYPYSLVLGAFPVVNYFLIQEDQAESLTFYHYQKAWTFLPEQLLSIESEEPKEMDYNISQDERISSKTLLPFMHALTHFGLPEYNLEASPDEVLQNRSDYSHRRLFKLGGWAVMLIFFISLLVNYLLFDHYSLKAKELESQLSAKKELLDKHQALKQELARKQQFLSASGFSSSAKLSFLADRIAQSVPASISLEKLSLNPKIKNKYKINETPEFSEGMVNIKGLTNESYILNNWVQSLSKFPWVQTVSISSYQYSERKKQSEFVLKLIYNK